MVALVTKRFSFTALKLEARLEVQCSGNSASMQHMDSLCFPVVVKKKEKKNCILSADKVVIFRMYEDKL